MTSVTRKRICASGPCWAGIEPFDPDATLFIDDSPAVLRAAREFGIQHILAVRKPDSKAPSRDIDDFSAINGFDEIMPGA